MIRTWCLAVGSSLILLSLATGIAQAQALYGITTGGQLITINPATGAGTAVASLAGPGYFSGLGFYGAKLYAVDSTADAVREINPATGATVTTFGFGFTTYPFGDLAIRSDGRAFFPTVNPNPPPKGDLCYINLPTGTKGFIQFVLTDIDGLAYDGTGVLFGLDKDGRQLHKINDVTGLQTFVGNTGVPLGYTVGGLAFDSGGKLFTALSNGGGSPSFLYAVNPATGAATLIGNIGVNDVSGVAFQPSILPGAIITQTGGSTDVTEGSATDTYSIRLNSAPTNNVTITITVVPAAQATVSSPTLTFTPVNWNTAQTVTVTAVDDAGIEGPDTATITHSSTSADLVYNGIAIASVTANITDNDVGPPPPPPPPPPNSGGGNSEGNYPGSTGGGEGGFGFGFGGIPPDRAQILQGPAPDGSNFRVRNVAHKQRSAIHADANTDIGFSPIGWSLVLALAAGVVLARKVAR